MPLSSPYMVFSICASAMLLSWVYFRRYRLQRPPIGVFDLGDVTVMLGTIILITFLYLVLPLWFIAGLLALSMSSLLYFTLEPILRSRWVIWPTMLGLMGADIWTNLRFGTSSSPFLFVNNIVLVLAIMGATNLWAQGGMKARDVSVLGVALAVYDLVATSLLPLMSDLFARMARIPFAPMVSWGTGEEQLSIGLGDLLIMTAFALVMRKAFGRAAGIVAVMVNLIVLATLLSPLILGNVLVVPVMTPLGPLMVVQYGYWLRRRGAERTTQQFLQAEAA